MTAPVQVAPTRGWVKVLLVRESARQPVVLLCEDLHWVDGETQTLLDNIVESLGSARLLLLVNYRPEYEHRWGSKTGSDLLTCGAGGDREQERG